MHISRKLLIAPAFLLAAACSSKKDDSAVDDALRNDLALAASSQPYQPQQFVSPMEQGYYGQNPAAMQYAPRGYSPYYQPAPQQVVYRTAPTARRSSSSGSSGSGTVYRAPATVTKHTKRDAAIGAAAGAVIGSQVHKKDRLLGGVVGAAAGAILGGAIGNNVDIDKH